MRYLCLSIVVTFVMAGCDASSSGGRAGNGGGAGGATSATGGRGGQAGHAGAGGSAGSSATGGSGSGGTIAHSGGAAGGGHSGNGGAISATGGNGGGGGSGGAGGGRGGSGGGGQGGTGGASGMVCGGLLARICGADQWCDFGDGTCGAGDQTGVCQPRAVGGVLCAPSAVCGCDGKTYPSACNAHQAGTDTTGTNACITGNGGTGAPCAADPDCAPGFKCCTTGGSVASPIACRQVAAGSQCPALP